MSTGLEQIEMRINDLKSNICISFELYENDDSLSKYFDKCDFENLKEKDPKIEVIESVAQIRL